MLTIRFSFLTTALCGFFLVQVYGQPQADNQPAQPMSTEVANLLRNAKAQRRDALRKHFIPILQDLAHRSDVSYQTLYTDAVYGAFFSEAQKPEKDFQAWQKTNKTLIDDPRLPIATQVASLNLQGQIHLIMGEEDKATSCFVSAIKCIANGPADLAGFHLMQESLQNSLLVKFYKIEPDYLKEAGGYTGAVSSIESLFKQDVLPWYEKNEPGSISTAWDLAIDAAGKIASVSEHKAAQFNLTDCPKLMVEKSDSLAKAGNKKEALEVLKNVLQRFPKYPGFDDVVQKIVALDSAKPSVSSSSN